MKTKKGFTLIEIIVCVALLSILGVSSILIANNTNKNNELEDITKKVLEAANVYIETEKDKHGNTYSYGIDNGGKGVTIPLNTLVNKGYVQNEDANKIKNLVNYSNDKDYYVLLAETSDLCETGAKFTKASWEIGDEEIYLCDYTPTPEGGSGGTPESDAGQAFMNELLNDYGGSGSIELKNEINHSDYKVIADGFTTTDDVHGTSVAVAVNAAKSGLFKRNDETYYYRGEIEDNYVALNGNFRIISFNKESQEIKLISEKVPSFLLDDNSISYGFENGYNNSKLKNNLEGWMGASYSMGGLNPNFVKESPFCSNTKTDDYHKNMTITISPCDESEMITGKIGLLTIEEAIYAGVHKNVSDILNIVMDVDYWFGGVNDRLNLYESNIDGYYELNNFYKKRDTFDSDIIYYNNNSYLSTGDTTFTLTNYKDGDNEYIYTLANVSGKPGSLTSYFMKGKMYAYKKTDLYGTPSEPKNEFRNYFRPVVVIDATQIESFSGKGTKNNPYNLTPKSTT